MRGGRGGGVCHNDYSSFINYITTEEQKRTTLRYWKSSCFYRRIESWDIKVTFPSVTLGPAIHQ